MHLLINKLISLLSIAGIIRSYFFNVAQGLEYPFTTPNSAQFVTDQRNSNPFQPADIISFRRTPIGFQSTDTSAKYIAEDLTQDLQTSGLPVQLQRTLSQYRITTNEPIVEAPNIFQNHPPSNKVKNIPLGFQPTLVIKPTTIRPNYSQIFLRSQRNHYPSQIETFLGQITLKSPFDDVKSRRNSVFPGKSQDTINSFESLKDTVDSRTSKNFIHHDHRSVITSDAAEKIKQPQVHNYIIINNEEIFTTENAVSSEPTESLYTEKFPKSNSKLDDRDYFPKNFATDKPLKSVDLEPLLEEPLKDGYGQNGDDGVEIIKSRNNGIRSRTTTMVPSVEDPQLNFTTILVTTVASNMDSNVLSEHHDTENLEYQYTQDKSLDNNIPNEYSAATSKIDNSGMEKVDDLPIKTTKELDIAYDVITMKTNEKIEDHNFYDFVDDISVESKESSSRIETTTIPIADSISSAVDIKKNSQTIGRTDDPEVIISVVTSKTVVNNTIVPMASFPHTQSEIEPFINSENTTDTWVVIASVQTSRSISGARFLSSDVKQEERIKLLNEDSNETENLSRDGYNNTVEQSREITNNTSHGSDETSQSIIVYSPSSTKSRISTESLLDKLDRVQSDLSSSLLTGGLGNNIAVINETMTVDMTTMVDLDLPISTTASTIKTPYLQVNIRKFSPANRPSSTRRPKSVNRTGLNSKYSESKHKMNVLDQFDHSQKANVSLLLPPDYKLTVSSENSSSLLEEILSKVKPFEEANIKNASVRKNKEFNITPIRAPDVDNKTKEKSTTEKLILNDTKMDDLLKFIPSGNQFSKRNQKVTETNAILKNSTSDDIVKFPLPEQQTKNSIILENTDIDISKLLPPGFKLSKTTTESSLFKNTKSDDISKFLPPGYKFRSVTSDIPKQHGPLSQKKTTDRNNYLSAETKLKKLNSSTESTSSLKQESISADPASRFKSGSNSHPANFRENLGEGTTTKSLNGFKVVFPSRPGGGSRKSVSRTTPRSTNEELVKVTAPTILKRWPSRATTEFTGWPTPSTTPISIEKLLEAARIASTSTTQTIETTISTTPFTTTTTSTTVRPTTPGICANECDLAGTIKLVAGVKWVPELLDQNTKEWQTLANEVQTHLNEVYSYSPVLSKWFKKIRIDGFSEGSILVDYLVELNDIGRSINTQEIKQIFHDSLADARSKVPTREGKSLNDSIKMERKLALGNFIVDPKFTDFIVLPKQLYPIGSHAEDSVLLPQWAIAVIVIGLASLLFVIIFGVTVLVNRQKNSKKKSPTTLTEDMLNELNKNHMGGFDNYGTEDLYNMEDVWNEREYDQKIPKKRPNGSIHDNNMSNIYDSWKSEWNGYNYNAYYGNSEGSSHNENARRRCEYDTNF